RQDHRKRHGRTPLEWRWRRKPCPYVVAVIGLEKRRTARTAAFHSLTLMAVSPSSSTRLLCQLLPSNRAACTASAVPPWLRLAVISTPPVLSRPCSALCSAGTGGLPSKNATS